MKTSNKLVATTLAAALATTAIATPSYAYVRCAPPAPPSVSGSGATPWFLGCIFGSAFGLIAAAYLKKNGELTTQQAQLIAFSCGLGAAPVIANFTPRL